ncbi:MAG: GNAT family N-acetyltransferase [Opitutales bacterium]|nr:GNAT family N-acetyltransferase [Opitutales bacterium]
MIRPCTDTDIHEMFEIINDSSIAYKGQIPEDRWHEPYMPLEELRSEIAAGVRFSGFEEDGVLLGVMGVQDVKDVTLIRHAYVRTNARGKGIGGKLLSELLAGCSRRVLIGTWKAARWAIAFYEKHGFVEVDEETKNKLLHTYWTVPERQIETSTVLRNASSVY